jgi:hypothetical protein
VGIQALLVERNETADQDRIDARMEHHAQLPAQLRCSEIGGYSDQRHNEDQRHEDALAIAPPDIKE